jgi:hypothetical protein
VSSDSEHLGVANEAQYWFLLNVLEANPGTDSVDVLTRRAEMLEDGVATAELVNEFESVDHTSMLSELSALRSKFWNLEQSHIQQRLNALSKTKFADVNHAAKKLNKVAGQLDSIKSLKTHKKVEEKFFRAFCDVLVSNPRAANTIRETQLRWMRPEKNPGYKKANKSIKKTAYAIKESAQKVYYLEKAWLDEILEFDPKKEIEDESQNILIGAGLIVIAVALVMLTVIAIQAILK